MNLSKNKTSKVVKTIGIAFNLKRHKVADEQEEEYDELATIEALETQIKQLGFKVLRFEQNDRIAGRLSAKRPDFVLNIAEGKGSGRGRESQIPCLLESLNIPYSGSDPVALGITLDKYVTSGLLRSVGVPVPAMHMVRDSRELAGLEGIFTGKSRFIVKPRWEGSSKGIFFKSVVDNFADLNKLTRMILRKYLQPAVVEEFLERDEITAAVAGNGKSARLLGMMKISPKTESKDPFLYSLENKRDWQAKIIYQPESAIGPVMANYVQTFALQAFIALELRDISRIDFRVDTNNIPRIIDINPLPGLSPYYSDLPILCRLNGMSYSKLVRRILREAFKRQGLVPRI